MDQKFFNTYEVPPQRKLSKLILKRNGYGSYSDHKIQIRRLNPKKGQIEILMAQPFVGKNYTEKKCWKGIVSLLC